LTDIRRVARVKTIAEALAVHPGRSIPQRCRSPSAVTATANLFQQVAATPENRQSGHRAFGPDALPQPGGSLFLADTTALSWSGTPAMAGRGPLGQSAAGLQGFFWHTVRRVRWPDTLPDNNTRQPVEVIGCGAPPSDVRTPWRQPRESSHERLTRPRASQIWPPASPRGGRAPAGGRWVSVADRAADIDASVVRCQALGHGWVRRAATERA
jgi:hypothetical protein